MAFLEKILSLYVDGFKNMKVGRKLWALIAIKLLILFGVFKIFFFPNHLKTNFETDQERSDHIINQLTTFKE